MLNQLLSYQLVHIRKDKYCIRAYLVLPLSYVLINSNLGTDVQIIKEVKELLADQNDVKLEIQGVYGVYDIIVKLSSDNGEKLKSIVTNDIRKIENVQSTLTMLVIEQQEKS